MALPPAAAATAIVLAAINLIEDEEEEAERMMMQMARIAVEEVMEMEEPGLGMDGLNWQYVTVNIDEYHSLGDPCFRKHFRMDRVVFENLIVVFGNHLTEKGRIKRERTPLQDILLMVVWLLATPDSHRSVSLRFGVHPSTLWYFYAYTIQAFRELADKFIVWPDAVERVNIKNNFQRATGFPCVVGSIDCTHVYVTAPIEDCHQYVNRHHSYSLNTQAVVDHNLLIRHLHVGEPGSMSDQRVFRRSPLCHDLLHRKDQILSPDEHLLGDGGYVIADFLLIPFSNNGYLTQVQRKFNKKQSQCRVRVENAFGRSKGKWRRLKFLYIRNPAIATDHIISSFVLHNFIILNGENPWENGELERPIRRNEVLGDNDDPDDPGNPDVPEDQDLQNPAYVEDEELYLAASAAGLEKRIYIMEEVLPRLEQEDDD